MTKPSRPPNRVAMETALRAFLDHAGFGRNTEGIEDTPARVARAFEEMTSGYWVNIGELLDAQFVSDYNGIVALRNIQFYSLCEHHLLPFHGVAHVAYIPTGKVVGLSKLARLTKAYAQRLQIQERMTKEIAAAIDGHLASKGTAVVIEATHLCMCARGADAQGVVTTTSEMTGSFYEKPEARAEVLTLLKGLR